MKVQNTEKKGKDKPSVIILYKYVCNNTQAQGRTTDVEEVKS